MGMGIMGFDVFSLSLQRLLAITKGGTMFATFLHFVTEEFLPLETEPLPFNASMKKIVVSILFALLWPFLCHGQSYEQMSRMDIKDLVGLGERRLLEENKPDQALMAFTLAMGRYRRNLDEGDKQLCMKACYGAWLVYFNHFCNYQKAFESIMTARDIADDIHQDQPKVYLLAGNIYQTISEQNNDSRLMRRAYTYYYKAFDMALVSNDRSSIDICFSNLLAAAHSLDCIDKLGSVWRAYSTLSVWRGDVRRRYNHSAYRMYILWHDRKLRAAIGEVEGQIRSTPADAEHVRLVVNALLNKGRLLFELRLTAGALGELRKAQRLADRAGLKDALLEIYELRARILQDAHQTKEANESYNHYLKLKDSLYISRQLSNIDEMQFGYDLKKKDEKLRMEQAHRQRLFVLAVTLVAIALVLAVMLLIIKRKNSELRESNRQLYLKSVAQLKSEANERVVTHKYEQEINDLQRHFATDSDHTRQRYKGSGLSDCDKGQVLARIKKVMEDVDEYCSPEFSVLRLSSLAGYKPKDISEVIHDFYNCNFNAFLNEYRIREACRRVAEDSSFTRLTIQGMANSVGFKSRSAFIAAFKKFAGLPPSEYIKISAQDRQQAEC